MQEENKLFLYGLAVMICSFPLIINIQFLLAQLSSPTDESTTHPTLTTLTKRINHLPAANNDSAITDEDTTVNINVLANDSDIDGDSLNVTGATHAKNGTTEFNSANNTISYTPTANFFGADAFDYTISDNNNGTASAKVRVTVSPLNDKPVAVNDTVNTTIGVPVNINVLANDSDIDGDSLNVTSVIAAPKNGTADFNKTSQIITYTPKTNFSGDDSFEYNVSDGNKGGLDTGTVTITVNEALGVVKSFFEEQGNGINIDQKTLLKVLFERPRPIPEGSYNIHIEGQVIGTNGSGISDEDIFVVFRGPNTQYQHTAKTDASGHFDFFPNAGNNIRLDKGTYVANASAPKIDNLNNSAQLIVLAGATSVPPEIWYSLFGLIPAFLIPSGVGAAIGWIQRRNLRQYREIIDNTYHTFEKSHKERQECLDRLDELEKKITIELEKKIPGISQKHYDLLMTRISDSKDKMKNTSS
jgi:Bacterial Ig domain